MPWDWLVPADPEEEPPDLNGLRGYAGALATSLSGEWNQKQSNRKSNSRHGYRSSQRSEMAHAASDEQGNARTAKTRERRGESKGAGPALRGILLGEPKRVDSKVGAAKTREK